ncbi:MAG: IS110 family transposase, partial [Gemmatimonadetes bacterium]|nr:IS110 family transposase [Gemmatimonadota bacterium]
IQKLIEVREDLKRRFEILTSIPGIANVTAAGLITHMPELGSLTGPRAASLAGLAPVTRESGSWKGRSFIQGGREKVRRRLYMPAVAAIRCNPHLGAKYAALRHAGKPAKVAITAIMRKLVVLANTLVQQDRLWTPRPEPSA